MCSQPAPRSALVDEDQGTHDDTGQSDAHTNDDPCHGPLVDVVQAIREDCKIASNVWEVDCCLRTPNVKIQRRNDTSSFHPTCCIRTGVSGVLATVGVSPLGCQFHDLREGAVTHLVSSRDFHQVDAPGLQLLQESHRMGPWRRKQAKKLIFKDVQMQL